MNSDDKDSEQAWQITHTHMYRSRGRLPCFMACSGLLHGDPGPDSALKLAVIRHPTVQRLGLVGLS